MFEWFLLPLALQLENVWRVNPEFWCCIEVDSGVDCAQSSVDAVPAVVVVICIYLCVTIMAYGDVGLLR